MDPDVPQTVTAAVARNRVNAGVLGLAWLVTLGELLAQDGSHWPGIVVGFVVSGGLWCVVSLALWHQAPNEQRLADMVAPLPEGVPTQTRRAYAIRAALWMIPALALFLAMQVVLGDAGGTLPGILAGGAIVSLVRATRLRRFEIGSSAQLLCGITGGRWRGRSVYYVRPA